MSVFNAFAERS